MVRVELKRDVLETNLVRQNCSKKELAYRIGVSRSYLSGVCTGRIMPSANMRQRFIDYFKCTFDDLFLIRNGEKCQTK
jgi:transcriptional regulator with XRE-family HTH domain